MSVAEATFETNKNNKNKNMNNSLNLTTKELTVLNALRNIEIKLDGDCTFIQDAYDNLKKEGMTANGFASLIGHLLDKGVFSYYVSDSLLMASDLTMFELTDEARSLCN